MLPTVVPGSYQVGRIRPFQPLVPSKPSHWRNSEQTLPGPEQQQGSWSGQWGKVSVSACFRGSINKSYWKEGGLGSVNDVRGHRNHTYCGPLGPTAGRTQSQGGEGEGSAGARACSSRFQESPKGEPRLGCQGEEPTPYSPYPQAVPECGGRWARQSGTSRCCGSHSGGWMTQAFHQAGLALPSALGHGNYSDPVPFITGGELRSPPPPWLFPPTYRLV